MVDGASILMFPSAIADIGGGGVKLRKLLKIGGTVAHQSIIILWI